MAASPMNPSQVKPAAEALARAFQEDPYYGYILPDAQRRRRIVPWIFERVLRYGLLYGKVYTTPAVEGAAIWLGPTNPVFGWWGAVRAGLFLMPLKMKRAEYRRIQLIDHAVDQIHMQTVTGPHWYLVALGVDPTCQGRRIGGALIQPVLEMAERENLACFLDTNLEKNLGFYGKHGFKVVGQEQPDPEGPYAWGMVRGGK